MRWRACIAWTWTAVILALCWFPRRYMVIQEGSGRPFLFPNFDKVVHGGIFLVFGLLWMWAWSTKPRALRVMAAGIVLAIASEIGQETAFVNRDANWLDGLADLGGLTLGVAACGLVMSRMPINLSGPRAVQPES